MDAVLSWKELRISKTYYSLFPGWAINRFQCEDDVKLTEVGTHNFFLSPQSQFPNLKEALPQLLFRNFLKKSCSATPTPQFRNYNFFWSSQLQVHNLRASIPQFSAYCSSRSSLKLYIFLPSGIFCYWKDFKGTVDEILGLCFLHESTPCEPREQL